MAENPYLDLAITVACERYELDENKWTLTAFSESAKVYTVAMESDEGCKVRATFPREEMRFEEMKRWSEDKKLIYVKNMVEHGHTLPLQLVDSFHDAMLKIEVPLEVSEEDTVIVEDKESEVSEVSEVKGEEETEGEFKAKTTGKKFKRKAV